MGNLNFDAKNHTPSEGYTPIPEGTYQAIIDKTEMKNNKALTGEFLAITWSISDGDNSGRTVIDRLNLTNPSEKAVQIAKDTLQKICDALEIDNLENHEDLRGKTAEIEIYIEEQSGYGPGNKIGEYRKSAQNESTPF